MHVLQCTELRREMHIYNRVIANAYMTDYTHIMYNVCSYFIIILDIYIYS